MDWGVVVWAGAVGAAGGGGVATEAVAGGDCAAGEPSSPVFTSAMGAPMGTVSPSWAMIRSSSPATGDGTSIVTLSVTTSTSGSYRSTRSPGCFSHLPMVPSTTLSPTWGSSINCATGYIPSRPRAGGFRRRWSPGWAYRRLPAFGRRALWARPARTAARWGRPGSRKPRWRRGRRFPRRCRR